MTENREFYIKYFGLQPVSIETHFIGEKKRERPLLNVGHLVAAYKTAAAPLLDNFSLAQLILHSSVDTEALRPGLLLSSLTTGTTDDAPLIIRIDNQNVGKIKNEINLSAVNQKSFYEILKEGHVNRPNQKVLNTIVKRYSQQLQAVLSIGSVEVCIDLYETVKALPSTFTRAAIENYMGISINGTMSLAQPNILVAADIIHGKLVFIKLLRIPDSSKSQSTNSKADAISSEINTCTLLSNLDIPGLVKCDVVKITVEHSQGLNESTSIWAALKMKRYFCSLTEVPQLTEKWLYKGFSRVLAALKSMHGLELVHMDVKSDNLFVDVDFQWDLGDFGSTRKVGDKFWSFTKVLNPYSIPSNATVIPAMDYVSLCVMIAIELDKDNWKQLCGHSQNVQESLILKKLNSMKNADFKKEVVELFEENLRIVREHLRNFPEMLIYA